MSLLVAPRGLWSEGRLRSGQAVRVERGRVAAIGPLGDATPDLAPRLLIPGLTDLQVNGGGGVMLNDDPTPEGLHAVVAAHRRRDTREILPTIITDAPGVAEAAAEAVLAIWGEPGLLGLHLEGPHIAPARRGTHDPRHIRPLDARTVRLVERLRQAGVPVMVTLAPERADPALLARLVASGAVVSAGHSSATAEEARAAFAAGVRCVTHLYNAMDPMTSRAPGLLGATLVSEVHAGLICDGIHVAWEMVEIALAARPRRGLTFAVSDAMATVRGPDRFTLYGQEIAVQDGALVNADGALAGAHLDMAQSLRNLVLHTRVGADEAIAMCTDTPRRVLGLSPHRIAPGTPVSEVLALDDDLEPVSLA